MPYIIRKTAENPIWKQFQERVKAEGRTLNWVIWELIRRYVEHGLEDSDPPTAREMWARTQRPLK